MPSVGPTEVLLVLVIALLVLGPHRLPEMARQLGRGIRQFREAARNVTREMGAEDLVEDLKGLNQARGTFGETVRKELGLDELGAFPDISEVVAPKPATPAAPPAASAAAEATPTAATTPVTTDAPVATPVEAPPADAAPVATAAKPKPARTRAPKSSSSEAATTGPKAAVAPKPKPARTRTAKTKPDEPA